jgi:signal transduction histidine kinase
VTVSARPPDHPPDTGPGLVEAITAITAISDRSQALQWVVEHACRLAGVRYGALMVMDGRGRPSEMFHHGTDVDTILLSSLVGTPVSVRGSTLGLLYLADHDDGSPVTEQQEAVVRALVSVAGYVIDHARTQTANERRRIWQNHAAALSATLQPPFDFSAADSAVTEVAMRAAGAVASTVTRLVDGELMVTATSGAAPTWVSSKAHEEAVHAVLDGVSGETEAGPEHLVMLASMDTHLSAGGVLAVYFPTADPPGDYEADLMAEFAAQAALTLDRARAFHEREQLSLVYDRDRIARELHDVVIQRLFATGLQLQKSRALATDPELRERLTVSMRDLDQTIRAIRETIFDLHR